MAPSSPNAPSDEYFIRCRRYLFGFMCLLTPAMAMLIAPFAYMGMKQGFTPATWIGFITTILLAFPMCNSPYWLLRSQQNSSPPPSETLVDLWLFMFNLLVNVTMVSFKAVNFIGMFYFTGLLDVACQTKRMRYHIWHTLLGLVVFKYNANYYDQGLSSIELRFPGARALPACMEPVMFAAAILLWVTVVSGVKLVLAEYHKTVIQAMSTSRLCCDVAEKLIAYDTDNARALIIGSDDKSSSTSFNHKVNEDLKCALLKMTVNLDVFRPHLPEYVWQQQQQQQQQGAGSSSRIDTPQHWSPHQHKLQRLGRRNSTTSSSNSSSNNNNNINNVLEPATNNPSQIMEDMIPQYNLAVTTLNYVSWGIFDFRGRMHKIGGVSPAAARNLVNWCHTHTMKSQGTVHTFIGDTAHVTWTFQHPSSKPALFMTRMYDAFTNGNNIYNETSIVVAGGLYTGSGSSYLVGDRRQGFMMEVEWRDQARVLYVIGRDYSAALMNEASYAACESRVTCQWVDTLPNSDVRVFEVVSEKPKGTTIGGGGKDEDYDEGDFVLSSVPIVSSTDGMSDVPETVIMIDEEIEDDEEPPPQSQLQAQSVTQNANGRVSIPKDDVSKAMMEFSRGHYDAANRLLKSLKSRQQQQHQQNQNENQHHSSMMVTRLHTRVLRMLDES